MPMDYSRYPESWKAISWHIRNDRAEWACEWCGAVHGEHHPITGSIVILTVAHLGTPLTPGGPPTSKHDKMDVREENLAALCQRCHLRYDRDEHAANAAATRHRKRREAGQLVLIEL